MFVYEQKTGRLLRDGAPFAQGYSGRGLGRNNPAWQATKDYGPLPQGQWRMVGGPYKHPKLGPFTINLEPCEGTETFGRSEFRIHGNNKDNDASHGCLIFGPNERNAWWDSGEKEFEVVSGL